MNEGLTPNSFPRWLRLVISIAGYAVTGGGAIALVILATVAADRQPKDRNAVFIWVAIVAIAMLGVDIARQKVSNWREASAHRERVAGRRSAMSTFSDVSIALAHDLARIGSDRGTKRALGSLMRGSLDGVILLCDSPSEARALYFRVRGGELELQSQSGRSDVVPRSVTGTDAAPIIALLEQREAVQVPASNSHPVCGWAKVPEGGSVLVVPVAVEDQLLGALIVDTPASDAFDEADRRAAKAAAALLGAGISI